MPLSGQRWRLSAPSRRRKAGDAFLGEAFSQEVERAWEDVVAEHRREVEFLRGEPVGGE